MNLIYKNIHEENDTFHIPGISIYKQSIYEQKISKNLKVGVSKGGIMTCSEHIILTETKFGIFDKEIYHDGESDPGNPFHYSINNSNIW